MPTQTKKSVKRQWAKGDYELLRYLASRPPLFGEVAIDPADLAGAAQAETSVSIATGLPIDPETGVAVIIKSTDAVFVMPPAALEAGLVPIGWRI